MKIIFLMPFVRNRIFSEAPWEKIDKALNFCRCPLKDNAGDNPVCSLTLVSELPDSDSQSFWGLLSTQTCRELNTEGFWLQSKLRTGNRFVRESNASDSPLGFCFQVKALLSVNSVVGASDIVHWGQECKTDHRQGWSLERPLRGLLGPWEGLGKNCEPFECPGRWIFWVVKKMQPGGGLAWDRDVFRSFFQPPGRFNSEEKIK